MKKVAFVSICLLFSFAIATSSRMGAPTPQDQLQVTEANLAANSIRESSQWIDAIPVASLRQKAYKLSALNSDLLSFFQSVVSPSVAPILLIAFYFVASYIPSAVVTSVFGLGKEKD